MKAVAVLLLGLSPGASAISQDFEAYKAKFRKTYENNDAETKAATCWQLNVKDIAKHEAANSMAQFDENDFSDMCWEDFARQRLGAKFNKVRIPRAMSPNTATESLKIITASPSVDWRTKGALAPVQDQGHCGSCWAFGTVANIEAQNFLWGKNNGTLVKLSEQELVSCDHYKDNTGSDKGCKGGFPDRAFHWMMQNNGLTFEKNYPYTSGGGQTGSCQKAKETPKALNIVNFQDLGANETYVAAYVAKYGPVVIGLDATNSWQQYKGGILTADCGSKQLDHAVAIVGYGSENGQDYWIIRNSWKASWGEQGHIRLARGVNCNGVVGHVSSGLFAERSLCLEDCGTSTCCGGDCCATKSGKEKCCTDSEAQTPTGCAHEGMACCGKEGGFYPCGDQAKCCGGACCDGESQCLTDGKSTTKNCCSKENICGGSQCCGGQNSKCCHAKDGSGRGSCMGVIGTCCPSGTVCEVMDTCCGSSCCKFMQTCQAGKCVGKANATIV